MFQTTNQICTPLSVWCWDKPKSNIVDTFRAIRYYVLIVSFRSPWVIMSHCQLCPCSGARRAIVKPYVSGFPPWTVISSNNVDKAINQPCLDGWLIPPSSTWSPFLVDQWILLLCNLYIRLGSIIPNLSPINQNPCVLSPWLGSIGPPPSPVPNLWWLKNHWRGRGRGLETMISLW